MQIKAMDESRQTPISSPTLKGSFYTPRTIIRRARQTTKQQRMVPLDGAEKSEWCYSFMLVPKVKGKVRLCLDLALFKSLIMPIQWVQPSTKSYVLAGVKYVVFIDTSSGYHKVNVDN